MKIKNRKKNDLAAFFNLTPECYHSMSKADRRKWVEMPTFIGTLQELFRPTNPTIKVMCERCQNTATRN